MWLYSITYYFLVRSGRVRRRGSIASWNGHSNFAMATGSECFLWQIVYETIVFLSFQIWRNVIILKCSIKICLVYVTSFNYMFLMKKWIVNRTQLFARDKRIHTEGWVVRVRSWRLAWRSYMTDGVGVYNLGLLCVHGMKCVGAYRNVHDGRWPCAMTIIMATYMYAFSSEEIRLAIIWGSWP